MTTEVINHHTRSPLAIHRTATTAMDSFTSDNSGFQTLGSDSENPDCSDDPLRQWSIPFSLITPELVRQTKEGLASLLLGRAVSWCTRRSGAQGYNTSVIHADAPCWCGNYRSFGQELGTSPTKARHAIDKLVRLQFLDRTGRDPLYLTPTELGWIFVHPETIGTTVPPQRWPVPGTPVFRGVPLPDPIDLSNDPALRPAMRRSANPGQTPRRCRRVVNVPSSFIVICHENFNAAITLSNLEYWNRHNHSRSTDRTISDKSGWFWKTWRQHQSETGLTLTQLRRAVAALTDLGFLETARHKTLRGSRLKAHFRLKFDAIQTALSDLDGEDGHWRKIEDESGEHVK